MAPLRPIAHPGQSDVLVHFTSRGRPTASNRFADLTAEQRLTAIMEQQTLIASPPYRSSTPVVCLSESGPDGVAALIRGSGWAPWGVVLDRQWVWDQGGGPVWYVRDDLDADVRDRLGGTTDAWLVRTEPGHSDWLHEREWRIPRSWADPSLHLDETAVVALLVGDPRWGTGLVHTMDVSPFTGGMAEVLQTHTPYPVPRWWWDGSELHEIDEVPVETIYLP